MQRQRSLGADVEGCSGHSSFQGRSLGCGAITDLAQISALEQQRGFRLSVHSQETLTKFSILFALLV